MNKVLIIYELIKRKKFEKAIDFFIMVCYNSIVRKTQTRKKEKRDRKIKWKKYIKSTWQNEKDVI